MPLRIIKASEPIKIEHICVTIYKLPGIGGTSLAFTAGKVLLFDTDDGSYRSANRGDTVRPKSWSEIANLTAADVEDYDVIAIDTVGRSLDMLTLDLIRQDPKLGRKSGDLSLQGFGALKTAFITWKNRMNSFGKDVIFCSHLEEKQEGDIVKDRFDIQGGSRSEIYKSSDAIAKLYIDNNTRKLDFSPREGSLGKNPAQFPILTVPNFTKEPLYFAGVLADIKKALNKMSEAQTQAQDEIQTWRNLLAGCSNAADFNKLLPQAKAAGDAVKMLVMAESKAKGVKFDKEAGEFYQPSSNIGAVDMSAPNPSEAPKPTQEPTDAPKTPPNAKKGHSTEPTKASDVVIPKSWEIQMHDARKKSGIPDDDYHMMIWAEGGYKHTREIKVSDYPKILKQVNEYELTVTEDDVNMDSEPA